MSLVTSFVGASPETSGTMGSLLSGGLGEIFAHLVGAVVALALVLGGGVAATLALSEPPARLTANRATAAITRAVPTAAPMMVLRRRRWARRCDSRRRRRS